MRPAPAANPRFVAIPSQAAVRIERDGRFERRLGLCVPAWISRTMASLSWAWAGSGSRAAARRGGLPGGLDPRTDNDLGAHAWRPARGLPDRRVRAIPGLGVDEQTYPARLSTWTAHQNRGVGAVGGGAKRRARASGGIGPQDTLVLPPSGSPQPSTTEGRR
jgi:hypothetical protein